MKISKKNLKYYFFSFFLIILILLFYFATSKLQNAKKLTLEPISINLLTSVHPDLKWNFKPLKSKILVKPGDVTNVEYIVENLGNVASTGIATFAYFPNKFGSYISKINCFCYDAQTLKPKQKNKIIVDLK